MSDKTKEKGAAGDAKSGEAVVEDPMLEDDDDFEEFPKEGASLRGRCFCSPSLLCLSRSQNWWVQLTPRNSSRLIPAKWLSVSRGP